MSTDPKKPVFNTLPAATKNRMDKQRAFVAQLVAKHFPNEKITATETDFALLQKILNAKLIDKTQTWELQSLGIVFGDALANFITGLAWWEITDDWGTDPTLRFQETTLQLNALTMLSKRVEEGKETDVAHMANWLKTFVQTENPKYI